METSILISSTSFYLISSVLGRTMFVQSIGDTSRKILNKIESKIYYHNNEIENMYIDTDIVATINTLQLLISEIEINNFNSSDTLNMALNNLNNIIIEIHDLIDFIQKKNQEHEQKIISYFRNLYLCNEIELIKKKNNILEKRLNLLIKIIQINRYTSRSKQCIENKNKERRIIQYPE